METYCSLFLGCLACFPCNDRRNRKVAKWATTEKWMYSFMKAYPENNPFFTQIYIEFQGEEICQTMLHTKRKKNRSTISDGKPPIITDQLQHKDEILVKRNYPQ